MTPLGRAGARRVSPMPRAMWVLGPVIAIGLGTVAAYEAEHVRGVMAALFLGGAVAFLLYGGGRENDPRWFLPLLVGGVAIRIPMALGHLIVAFWIYGGDVDMPGYAKGAAEAADYLASLDTRFLTFDQGGSDRGVGVVVRLLAVAYLLVGSSLAGMALFSGLVGFVGSYLFLRAAQTQFPEIGQRPFLPAALFLLPSVAFWTSLLGKDSWMYLFLASATYCVAHFLKTGTLRHLVGFGASVAMVTIIRAPVGVALATAGGVAFLLFQNERLPRHGPTALLRPILSLGALVIVLSVGSLTVGMSQRAYQSFFEDRGLASGFVALAAYKHEGLATDTEAGGSSLEARISSDASAGDIAGFLPLAMFTFLFRPLIFEAHNALAVVAAVDGTLLLAIVLWRWRSALAALRLGPRKPFIAFVWIAFLVLTAGLSFEANFGVIVRHRTMVLSFLLLLLAVPTRRAG